MRFVTTCGLVGLSGGFLMISPPLRESLMDVCDHGQQILQAHQPYSYVGLGALMLVALGTYMYRCSQPR